MNRIEFPKGAKIEHYKFGKCYIGGYSNDKLSLCSIESCERLTRYAKITDCIKH